MWMFKLRGNLSRQQEIMLTAAGFLLFVLLWWILAEAFSIKKPVIAGYDTALPSIYDEGSTIDLDSLARADSIAYANATEFTKAYPILPPPLKVITRLHRRRLYNDIV